MERSTVTSLRARCARLAGALALLVTPIASAPTGLGCRACDEESPRALQVVDARNGKGVCAMVEVKDGDDIVERIEVTAVDSRDGTCSGAMSFPTVEAGTYVFRITAAGFQTLEKKVELAERPGCDYVTDAAFEGFPLVNDQPLLFRLIAQ